MKRIIFIAVALCTISTVVANTVIQTEFNGIVLGKSSRNEVSKILASNGQLTSSEKTDTLNITIYNDFYNGEYMHEEMQCKVLSARFLNDTLIALFFDAACDSACIEYSKPFIEKIHSKYDNLATADGSLMFTSATKDLEGYNIWSRKDDENVVLTELNDTACTCAYFAEHRFIEISFREAINFALKSMPDYAEENKVYGVGGVKFGDSKESVKSVMFSKSGRLVEEDAYNLIFRDTKIGGRTYDFTTFYFSSNQLISVNLQNIFYEWQKEEALMLFEDITSQYGRKYTNLKMLVDEEDEKAYACGAFIEGYDYLPIVISFVKSLSRGGDIMYYVDVDYYSQRKSNLYDDEI